MSESEQSKSHISANFGEQGGRYEWANLDELLAWMVAIQQQWSWIASIGYAATNTAWNTISNRFNNIVGLVRQAKDYLAQGQETHSSSSLRSGVTDLERFVSDYPWLLKENAQTQFIEELRQSGKQIDAGLIVAKWLGQDFNGVPVAKVVDAFLAWELYLRGIKNRVKHETAALKKLAGDMQTTLVEYQEAKRVEKNRFDELHAEIVEKVAQQESEFEESQNFRDSEWKRRFAESQAELNKLVDTYDKHMALQAPVDYWETKRKKHKLLVIWFGVAVVFAMAIALGLLYGELKSVGDAILASKALAITTSQAASGVAVSSLVESASTWHLGAFILSATMGFWLIRLLVRIFLSNMHLENDAAERVVMAKTYLAIIRNEDLPQGDGTINTVFAALFRPGGDGIVKDEGVPPSTLEWFTKLGK